MNIQAIIIDDEVKPAESLKIMLDELGEGIQCLGMAHDVMEGMKLIQMKKPHLVFLDIHMPQYSGFDLLEALGQTDVLIVFTTAHEEYAIQAIKHKAFDYLLKPIDADELKTCIEKIREELNMKQPRISARPSLLHIAVKEGTLILKQSEILRIEASGSYSVIYLLEGKTYTVTKNLKALENNLDRNLFFRCHHSHIVNLDRIRKILKNEGFGIEMSDGSVISVSRDKRDELMNKL
jgi:two-component system LytT family response regulator